MSAPKPQTFQFLNLGSIKPSGWMREQMRSDLEHGFVGHLDELVPDLIQRDDIYGADRLSRTVGTKELGVLAKEKQWEVQFLWWNSETQSNWLDGMLRNALLLDHPDFIEKARVRIEHLLSTQDEDGYLGIYAPDLRFNFDGENGELWAQASLFRVLLGWYEGTGDQRAFEAVRRGVEVIMQAYPVGCSHPFRVKNDFAGVCHGLMLTDTLDRLYQLTGEAGYLDYAKWLYFEYSDSKLSADDVSLAHLQTPRYRFKAHGPHTYEHLRSLLTARYAEDDPVLNQAMAAYLKKLDICLTPGGGPIGDEMIGGRRADASETGYEYCSLQELFDSYSHLLQKTGDMQWANRAEWLFFNAGQGARHPAVDFGPGVDAAVCPGIAYLKTDNSSSMT
ncbi:MAG: beta-L-arabinofuranosidase domain-containing protein, partial [Chloroflexota bacterium]